METFVTKDAYLAAHLIGFSAGTVIAILLLVLTVRAAKYPGTPVANIMLAVCSLTWNAAGLFRIYQHLWKPVEGPAALALAIQFTAAAIWPIPILWIWSSFADRFWQKRAITVLQVFAFASAVTISICLWLPAVADIVVLPNNILAEAPSYSGLVLAIMGTTVLLGSNTTSRAGRSSAVVVSIGILVTTLTILCHKLFRIGGQYDAALSALGRQSPLLIVLGVFLLVAHFRYADLFIRCSVRILMAGMFAVALVFITEHPYAWDWTNCTLFPNTTRVFELSVLATVLLVSFVFAEPKVESLVNRWAFCAVDYRDATHIIAEKLQTLHLESDAMTEAVKAVEEALGLSKVHLVALSTVSVCIWPAGISDGETIEIGYKSPLRTQLSLPDLEFIAPVRTAGQVTHVFAISLGAARRSLVSQELEFLRIVAAQLGSRLDCLRMDQQAIERQNRETMLLQQAAEAELRALRAQINPHFLFNSLNSIANLVVSDPPRAETMTLRLARVFRYVLAHSQQPMTTIRDEMDFLRTYLEIEQARFGDRLNAQFYVDQQVAKEALPSLILQPLVENALKHGLFPKPGLGLLLVSALPSGNRIAIKVEDDGVGWQDDSSGDRRTGKIPIQEAGSRRPVTGHGLSNVAQRLATLYGDRAHLNIDARDNGGTIVTLLVPRQNVTTEL